MGRLVLALATMVPAVESSAGAGALRMRLLPWQSGKAPVLIATGAVALGLLAVLVATARFDEASAARVSTLALVLIACTATDLLAYRVPDAITLPGLAIALAGAAFQGESELASSIGGASMAGGMLLVAAVLTRGGLGGGDVKLGALIGAALGLPAAAFALAAGIAVGATVVIGLHLTSRLGRDDGFPFAPFLAIAALVFLLAS